MSNGTETLSVLVSTIIGTAVAMTTVITASIGGRMTTLDSELRATRIELRGEIPATRTELRDEIRALDTRVRTVETGFTRVDQRFETIERAVLPSAEAPR